MASNLSLMIATASRGALCASYVHSLVGLQQRCASVGIPFELKLTEDIRAVDRARNLLASAFIQDTEASHMLFIDDDMGFDPDDVMRMLDWGKRADVVAAMSPNTRFDWERVKRIVLANPEIPASHLPSVASSLEGNWRCAAGGLTPVSDQPVLMDEIGAGLMLISRRCLVRLIADAERSSVTKEPFTGTKVYEFFRSRIIHGRYQDEAGYFCERVRSHGGDILGCPWVTTTRMGKHAHVSDLKTLAHYQRRTTREVPSHP